VEVHIACLGSKVKTDVQRRLDESNIPATQRQHLRDALRLIPTCRQAPIRFERPKEKEESEGKRKASAYNRFTGECMKNPEKFDLEAGSMSRCAEYWQEHKEELKEKFG